MPYLRAHLYRRRHCLPALLKAAAFAAAAGVAALVPGTAANAQLDPSDRAPEPGNTAASPGFASGKATRIVRQAARGVALIQEIIPDNTAEGPLVINILRIDPQAKGVRIEAALGQDRVWGRDATLGREVVSVLAARRKAVGGINAGFFPFAGNPIGLHIQDGEIITEPMLKRSTFYVTKKGKAGIASFDYGGSVKAEKEGETYPIHGINRRPGKGNELLLFTPVFLDTTLPAPGRFEVVLRAGASPPRVNHDFVGTVLRVNENGGETPLDKGTIVLSGGGSGAAFLRQHGGSVGKKLTLRLTVTSATAAAAAAALQPASLREAVTGGPRLLTGGKIDIPLTAEGMSKDFSDTRHPRTAVGITKNGAVLFVTVDGRQKGLSRGVTLPELATLLLKRDAVEGVNLDGGGSTAMIVRDAIVNSPSEGRERPIASALLVFADDIKAGKAEKPLFLTAPFCPLFVGETWYFAGQKTPDVGIWGTKGGTGFVSQEGVFRALRPGKAEVLLFVGGKTGTVSATITIKPAPAPITLPAAAPTPAAAAAPAMLKQMSKQEGY